MDKPLIEHTKKELQEALRTETDAYMRDQLLKERAYQSQDENTKALNRWTFWIAVATLLNAIATCVLVIRTLIIR